MNFPLAGSAGSSTAAASRRGSSATGKSAASPRVRSGSPLTAQVAGNQSNNNGSGAFASERPDATGQPVSLPRSDRTTLDFFNTAAFALPASGQLGTAGRNTITGPGMVNFNMSLGRFFTFSREKNSARAVQH